MKTTKNKQENEYENRRNLVESIINSKHMTRIFFLILDGIDYTEKIAEVCKTTPKSMTINLRKLREARIIKRKEREGRIQRYEPDWEGILDILFYHYTPTSVGVLKNVRSYLSSILSGYNRYISIGRKVTDKNMDITDKIFRQQLVDIFLKDFFIFRKDYEKETITLTHAEHTSEKKGKEQTLIGLDTSKSEVLAKYFDGLSVTLKEVLKEFSNGLKMLLEERESEIKKLYEFYKKKKDPKLLILSFLLRVIEEWKYEKEAWIEEAPEKFVINSFHEKFRARRDDAKIKGVKT